MKITITLRLTTLACILLLCCAFLISCDKKPSSAPPQGSKAPESSITVASNNSNQSINQGDVQKSNSDTVQKMSRSVTTSSETQTTKSSSVQTLHEGILGYTLIMDNNNAENGYLSGRERVYIKCSDGTYDLSFLHNTVITVADTLTKSIGSRKIVPMQDVLVETPAGRLRFLIGATYRVKGTVKSGSITVNSIELVKLNRESKIVD